MGGDANEEEGEEKKFRSYLTNLVNLNFTINYPRTKELCVPLYKNFILE